MSELQTVPTETKAIAKKPLGLRDMLADVKVKARFEEILGKKAPGFISSIISAAQMVPALQKCEPGSVVGAAAVAASLDLPINQSLGQAAIVPYGNQAQFQIMSRGYIQLAQRSGQYLTMNASPVLEGQLVSNNPITGECVFDAAAKKSEKVIGYVFFFKLLNGFEKYTYMTVDEIQAHGKKYAKSYANEKGLWKTDFQSMALKTVVKRGLSKWGPLSTEMQKAIEVDQAAIRDDGTADYIDSTATPDEAHEGPKRKSETESEKAIDSSGIEFAPEQ